MSITVTGELTGDWWMLGVAKIRAVRILALLDKFPSTNDPASVVLDAVRAEAQAILDDRDIE